MNELMTQIDGASRKVEVLSTPQKIAATVLSDLANHQLDPTPENFTVWYFYLTEIDADLCREINSLLSSAKPFDEEDISALFETYFGVSKQNKEIENITEQLIGEMTDVLVNLKGANSTSSSYGDALQSLSGAMGKDHVPVDIKPVIQAVSEATQKMVEENATLGNQLTSSSAEISKLKADLEDMRLQAMTDGLTGIANRKCFDIEIENAIRQATEEEASVCMLMMDIDHFKMFNDTHGHQMGDQVLKLLAEILKDTVKGQDTPARYGGEEFAIILPETDLTGAVGLAEALRKRIVRRPLVNKKTGTTLGTITISAGAAQHRPDETAEELIARADKALYEAKTSGRDRVVSG